VNPDDLHRLRPVLNLFFQQAIGLQTRELPERNPALKYQVMMLLDEFTSLGRIPIIAEAISYLPGFNVRVVLVIQTPAQLREVYGIHAAETMLKSLAARIVFAPKDFGDAKEISDELGFTTVPARTVSTPIGAAFDRRGGRSKSQTVSLQRRALLLPQEVKELGTEKAIVFYEGLPPIRCRKIRYYSDGRFRKRLLRPPPVPARHRPAAVALAAVQPARGSAPAEALSSHESSSAPQRPKEDREVIREATVKDIERIESLTLDDFATDFSKMQFPDKEGPLTEPEIHMVADSFLATLK
jgi:type IV secretion system protein VirD4